MVKIITYYSEFVIVFKPYGLNSPLKTGDYSFKECKVHHLSFKKKKKKFFLTNKLLTEAILL